METKILTMSDSDLSLAAEILKSGGIVGMPTETVYGLAGNALDRDCVNKIFAAKGRPSDNPLIVHISDISQWTPLVAAIPEEAMALAESFWPGPLTIILPKSDLVPQEICGKLSTVAVRMPKHEAAVRLIEKCGFPLAAPSANTSGKPSPTKAEHVYDDLKGKIQAIIDGGDSDVGVESTVLSLAVYPPRIYRPGGITAEMLTEILGEVEIDESVFAALKEGQEVHSPGTMYKHYSPKAEVWLVKGGLDKFTEYVKTNADDSTAVMCFEGEESLIPTKCLPYGKKDDPASQAKHIFDVLRRVDKIGAKKVYVRYPLEEGVGLAVFNRLARACAFKIIDLETTDKKILILGLTGKTGAGKSTVASRLEKKGCYIIDGDVIARNITEKGSKVLPILAKEFGNDIIDSSGELDRRLLASRAFASRENTDKLNAITHPAITERFIEEIRKAESEGYTVAVIDAAALLESYCKNLCEKIVVVTAPEEIRLERILQRDGIKKEQAMTRIKAQQSDEFYARHGDIIIRNYPPYDRDEGEYLPLEELIK